MLIPISEIIIGERFRKDMGGLEELSASILVRGQLQNIVIDKDKNLLAGERRLTCIKALHEGNHVIPNLPNGMIEATFYQDADELTRREIELEENLCRENFTDEEKVKAVLEIHRLKQAKYGAASQGSRDGTWGIKDTAESLAISKSTVYLYKEVAEALEDDGIKAAVAPVLAKEGIVQAHKAACKAREKQLIAIRNEQLKQIAAENVGSDQIPMADAIKKADSMLFHADCLDWIKQVPDASIDFCHTDPPYGINIDKLKVGGYAEDVYSNDTSSEFRMLWNMLAPELYRVMKDDTFLFIWCGWTNMQSIVNVMTKSGFKASPVPFVWVKPNGECRQPHLWFASACDFAMVFAKGKPTLEREGQKNYSLYDPSKKAAILGIHAVERPVLLLLEVMGRFLRRGMKVIEPFSGSGSTQRACLYMGVDCIGCEKDQDNYNIARLELIKAIAGRSLEEGKLEDLGFTDRQIAKMSDETKERILKEQIKADNVSILPDGTIQLFQT